MKPPPEYILAGVLMKQHFSAGDTGGSFSMFENRSSGQSRTPIHVHSLDDETLYMLEGEMTAIIAGQEHRITAGASIFLPRGVPHQLLNASGAPTHYLLLCTPSGFEGFLAEGGHLREQDEEPRLPTQADIERLKSAAPKFGITLLSGW
jgi:quercetin dioxygenase-like cupin family protein